MQTLFLALMALAAALSQSVALAAGLPHFVVRGSIDVASYDALGEGGPGPDLLSHGLNAEGLVRWSSPPASPMRPALRCAHCNRIART